MTQYSSFATGFPPLPAVGVAVTKNVHGVPRVSRIRSIVAQVANGVAADSVVEDTKKAVD